MRKLLLITMISAFSVKTFSQDTNAPALTKEYYLQKSKKQKTAAWVLLGCGTAAMIGGYIALNNNYNPFEPSAGDDLAALLALTGFGATIGSIPVFINAGKNKGRSEDVTFPRDYYLQKNKGQKTAAWILLAGGIALTVASIATSNNNLEHSNGDNTTSTLLAIAGFTADISSIVLFSNASKNKGRAEVAFNTERSYSLQANSIRVRPVPALTIRFSF